MPPRGESFDRGIWAAPLELKPVFDYSNEGALRSYEQSANRLGFSDFDVVHIHDVDRFTHGDAYEHVFDQVMNGCYRALDELRAAGHIGAIGVGVNESDVAARFVRAGYFDVVMIAGRYTLLDNDAFDELVSEAARRGTAVVAAAVFNSGVLAAARAGLNGSTYFYRPASDAITERVSRLAEVCAKLLEAMPIKRRVLARLNCQQNAGASAELNSQEAPLLGRLTFDESPGSLRFILTGAAACSCDSSLTRAA